MLDGNASWVKICEWRWRYTSGDKLIAGFYMPNQNMVRLHTPCTHHKGIIITCPQCWMRKLRLPVSGWHKRDADQRLNEWPIPFGVCAVWREREKFCVEITYNQLQDLFLFHGYSFVHTLVLNPVCPLAKIPQSAGIAVPASARISSHSMYKGVQMQSKHLGQRKLHRDTGCIRIFPHQPGGAPNKLVIV